MATVKAPQQRTQADSSTAPKILRIGVLQNGKIVEERLVRRRENVTVGQSTKNTFVVPASAVLPRSFTLFEISPQGYALNFTDGMDGRVSLGEQVVALPALRQAGKAQKKGDMFHLPLSDKARGKVVIGDVTILFQFVQPPPVQPRPQLPPSVRSNLMQNLDWMLVAVVGASFLVHFGFVIWLRNIDWPRKPDIEELPDRFVKMIVPPKKEEKKVEVAKTDDGKKKEDDAAKKKKADDAAKKAPPKPRDAEAEARAAAERRAKIAQEAARAGVLKVLGAKGEGGSLFDTLKGGDVSGDADKTFAQVGGVGVSSGEGGIRGKGTGGTGSMRAGGDLRASGPGSVGTGEKGAEKAVRGIVKDSTPMDVDGSLDPSIIAKEIRSRIGAIKACYESVLKRNPSAGGKVVLRFEVSTVGKVTKADIDDDSIKESDLNSCIKSRVLTWRFPAPAGGSVQFSYPFIFQPSK